MGPEHELNPRNKTGLHLPSIPRDPSQLHKLRRLITQCLLRIPTRSYLWLMSSRSESQIVTLHRSRYFIITCSYLLSRVGFRSYRYPKTPPARQLLHRIFFCFSRLCGVLFCFFVPSVGAFLPLLSLNGQPFQWPEGIHPIREGLRVLILFHICIPLTSLSFYSLVISRVV